MSLDYIFGRTDKPEGRLYEFKSKVWKDNKKMELFMELCFEPKSPMNEWLKKTLLQILSEVDNERH